ncbi:MAG: hypothetical protein NXI14_00845 [bacterium]|nr:hypothetical protein [bacterium]
MSQAPRKPKSSFAREVAGDVAKDTGKLLGMAAFQALGILGLILLGAVVCGAGLYFSIHIVAIIGGVLIGAGLLWAAVLAFIFFAPTF